MLVKGRGTAASLARRIAASASAALFPLPTSCVGAAMRGGTLLLFISITLTTPQPPCRSYEQVHDAVRHAVCDRRVFDAFLPTLVLAIGGGGCAPLSLGGEGRPMEGRSAVMRTAPLARRKATLHPYQHKQTT